MLKETTDKLFSQMPSMGGVKEHLDQRTRGDKYIWALVLVLSLISIMVVYSATGSLAYKMSKGNTSIYLFKQVAFTLIGLVVVFALHRINYTVFSRVATVLFILSVPLLIYTLFFGAKINEGSRWIKLPIINMTIQSSDVAKLALFMYISRVLSKKQEVIKDFRKGFWPVFWPVLLICGLIMPANLSNALLTGATSLLLMFIGRINTKHILATIGIGLVPIILLVSVAVKYYDKVEQKQKELPAIFSGGRIPTWISRIQTFIYTDKNTDSEKLYQTNQAKIAVANGGWIGKGPGNSTQRNFLPHSYSDFIYAIIIEEYGFLGASFMMFIYLLFLMMYFYLILREFFLLLYFMYHRRIHQHIESRLLPISINNT